MIVILHHELLQQLHLELIASGYNTLGVTIVSKLAFIIMNDYLSSITFNFLATGFWISNGLSRKDSFSGLLIEQVGGGWTCGKQVRNWNHAWSFAPAVSPWRFNDVFSMEKKKRLTEPSITIEEVNNTLKTQWSWFLKVLLWEKEFIQCFPSVKQHCNHLLSSFV